MRSFVSILSIAVIVSPIWFIATPTIQSAISGFEEHKPAPGIQIEKPVDIVVIVFDELPLVSLLDEHEQIDQVMYPNFRRLAESSTWYRNTLSIHFSTWEAIASILIGDRFASYRANVLNNARRTTALLNRDNAPDNLFSLVEGQYRVIALENTSGLALKSDFTTRFAPPIKQRVAASLLDAAIIYAHVVVPERARNQLPLIEGQWGGFKESEIVEPRNQDWPYAGRANKVEQFVNYFQATEKPTLYYLHVLLPHFPFINNNEGTKHGNKFQFLTEQLRKSTGSNNWPNETTATLAWQAHLFQLGFTDLLLGKIIDQLEELGLYKESLLIVTADHGTSFFYDTDELPIERMKVIQASETLQVPLLIKYPGQNKGVTSQQPAQIFDVLPTVADVIGIEIPWEIGGQSLVDVVPADRQRYARVPDERKFGQVIDAEHTALAQKIQLFGSQSIERLYLAGPHREIAGKPLSEYLTGEVIGSVNIDQPEKYEEIDLQSLKIPAYVEGEITIPSGSYNVANVELAVAINGVIRNTTKTTNLKIGTLMPKSRTENSATKEVVSSPGLGDTANRAYFLMRVPPSSFINGKNEVSIHAINTNDDGKVSSLQNFNDE
jgi:hypothetical protein